MASATSGIRAVSALRNTMAVITCSPYRLVDRRDVTSIVERHEALARLVDGVMDREMTAGTGHGAGPLPVDVDQPEAGRLEPSQDHLRLLGRRGRRRAGARGTVSALAFSCSTKRW